MSITQRLIKLIENLDITVNGFAAKIGVSQPRLRNYLSGRAPDYDVLNKICITFVSINPDWLLTGRGSMMRGVIDVCTPVQNDGANIDADILNARIKDIERLLAEKDIRLAEKDALIKVLLDKINK